MKTEVAIFKLIISEGVGHAVDIVDATDNGSLLFAEVQVEGHRIGDLDLQALSHLRICDIERHMAAPIKLMKQELTNVSNTSLR